MKIHNILSIFIIYYYLDQINAIQSKISKAYRIKNFSIQQCNDDIQPLLLENITIATTNAGDLAVSGTMSSSVNLDSPIKVSVNMKRKFLGLWFKVFCIDNLGSCTYSDFCSFGIAENLQCPERLAVNNVPCRCPIAKGTYTLPEEFEIPKEAWEGSIISGKYSGQIIIKDTTMQLGCYNTLFTIY